MILTQNGELFYTGSHVFGNNETPVGEGPNAEGRAAPRGARAAPASSTSPTSSSPVPGPT